MTRYAWLRAATQRLPFMKKIAVAVRRRRPGSQHGHMPSTNCSNKSRIIPTARLVRELSAAQKLLNQYERGWRPGHFYSPIPSLEEVRRRESQIFADPGPILPGIELREQAQLALLDRMAEVYHDQPFTGGQPTNRRYLPENENYSLPEAIVLYCMIRLARPQRIIEIGSGHSSCAILDTNESLGGYIQCTFIEPYSELLLSLIKRTDRKHVEVVESALQDVDREIFAQLKAGDILFVDSTHVAKVGSDVNQIIFELLPALPAGVHVHFHDIYYPFEYPREWIYQGRAWNEAYVLRAFLQYNMRFGIEFFNSFMGRFHNDALSRQMPICAQQIGSSLWLQPNAQSSALDQPSTHGPHKA